MTATIIYNFTSFIVSAELKPFRAGTDNSSSRNNRTVVATASVVQRTFVTEVAFVRPIWTVLSPIAEFLRLKAD